MDVEDLRKRLGIVSENAVPKHYVVHDVQFYNSIELLA